MEIHELQDDIVGGTITWVVLSSRGARGWRTRAGKRVGLFQTEGSRVRNRSMFYKVPAIIQ